MFSRHLTKILLFSTALSMVSACAVVDKRDTPEESNWFVQLFEKDGRNYAEKATLAYSNGQFQKTLEYTTEALKANPRNEQALLVGALAAEKLGRYNKARQYYEDLIIIDGAETSILGSSDGQPQKTSAIAKKNLRAITIAQSNLTIESRDGHKHFAISESAGENISKNTIAEALSKKNIPAVRSQPVGVDDIFTPEEQNIVSRFLILKELAEKDFITKEEFLSRRSANIGGLLPLTRTAPGVGIDQPVPSPDLIIERLEVLKEGVETRAITPREFSAERDVIIEALMSPNPRQRTKNKAPSKNILDAAKDLRRLEVLDDLNLITDAELRAEKKAIEKYLGINRDKPKPVATVSEQPQTPEVKVEVVTPSTTVTPQQNTVTVTETTTSTAETETAQPAQTAATPIAPLQQAATAQETQAAANDKTAEAKKPDVTSPF